MPIANIAFVVDIDVMCYSPANYWWVKLPFSDMNVWVSPSNIFTQSQYDRSTFSMNYLTLRYTCTDR